MSEYLVGEALGLDLGLSKDRGVLADVGVTVSGFVVVLGMTTWTPPPGGRLDLVDIEASATEAALALRCPLVLDPWQAILLGQRATARGAVVIEHAFTATSRAKLFGRLLDLVRTRRLKCPPHEALRKELLGLQVSETISGYRVDHKGAGSHDDHAVAIALAVAGLAEQRVAPEGPTSEEEQQLRVFCRAYGFSTFDPNVVIPDWESDDDGSTDFGFPIQQP
jgi:hypothetical protein